MSSSSEFQDPSPLSYTKPPTQGDSPSEEPEFSTLDPTEEEDVEFGDTFEIVESIKPWYVYIVLLFAIFAVSSAGAVMKTMKHAAPLTRASWRLQATSIILLPGFLYQWKKTENHVKEDFLEHRTLLLLLGSGIALAFHFALWVLSIDHTSLPHSLLFVCSIPLILVFVAWIKKDPLSPGELGGVFLGFLGAVIMVSGSTSGQHSESEVTIGGDFSAFLAATAFVAYITTGGHLREWMPLYLYALPVTALASIFLLFAGLLLEGWNSNPEKVISGPFGWFSTEFFLPNLYLGFGPGFIGHTGLNYSVKYLSPLIISMAITVEPLLGSAIGWLIGASGPPGSWTYIGGAILIFSTLLVNVAGELKKLDSSKGRVSLDDDDDWDATSLTNLELGALPSPRKGQNKGSLVESESFRLLPN